MSLYIPHVFSNITRERITKAVEHLGIVRTIDLVRKTGKDGKSYNAAYIHFEYWHDNTMTRNFQERLTTGEARIIYEDPWFWIVLENHSTAKTPSAVAVKPTRKVITRKVVSSGRNLSAIVATASIVEAAAIVKDEMDCIPEESFDLVDVKYVEALERENARLNGLLRRELERSF
jgi:hypothetical protein